SVNDGLNVSLAADDQARGALVEPGQRKRSVALGDAAGGVEFHPRARHGTAGAVAHGSPKRQSGIQLEIQEEPARAKLVGSKSPASASRRFNGHGERNRRGKSFDPIAASLVRLRGAAHGPMSRERQPGAPAS